jgi:hypothetical protein
MGCADFEERLIDYKDLPLGARREVDRHLAVCADCQKFWEFQQQLDGELTKRYSSPAAPGELQSRIRSRISAEMHLPRVSFLPEVLDFVGGAALVAIAARFTWMLISVQAISLFSQLPVMAGSLAVAGAAWVGARAYADLK